MAVLGFGPLPNVIGSQATLVVGAEIVNGTTMLPAAPYKIQLVIMVLYHYHYLYSLYLLRLLHLLLHLLRPHSIRAYEACWQIVQEQITLLYLYKACMIFFSFVFCI